MTTFFGIEFSVLIHAGHKNVHASTEEFLDGTHENLGIRISSFLLSLVVLVSILELVLVVLDFSKVLGSSGVFLGDVFDKVFLQKQLSVKYFNTSTHKSMQFSVQIDEFSSSIFVFN